MFYHLTTDRSKYRFFLRLEWQAVVVEKGFCGDVEQRTCCRPCWACPPWSGTKHLYTSCMVMLRNCLFWWLNYKRVLKYPLKWHDVSLFNLPCAVYHFFCGKKVTQKAAGKRIHPVFRGEPWWSFIATVNSALLRCCFLISIIFYLRVTPPLASDLVVIAAGSS